MGNKETYWDFFYKKDSPPQIPSTFSNFVLRYIDDKDTLLDIGCGNGRDSIFFVNNGFDVTSVDNSNSINFLGNANNFYVMDVTDINFKKDVYYARFFIHTITEEVLDIFIEKLYSLMDENSVFVFETRSTKGIINKEKEETYFKSSIGEEHFRMLYSKEYLENKLTKRFEIVYFEEKNNVAIHKEDNPYVLRGVVKKK